MDLLLTASAWPLMLAALLAFAESAVGVGVLLPGEVAITALTANMEGTQRFLAVPVIAFGATAGDHTGYLLGRHFGSRLASSRLIRRVGTDRWTAATRLIERHGSPAVFVSRLLPFVRTVMPAVAGVAGLGYARFAIASIAGSTLWATLWVSAGGALSALGLLGSPATAGLLIGLGAAIVVAAAALRSSMSGRQPHRARCEPTGVQDMPPQGARMLGKDRQPALTRRASQDRPETSDASGVVT